MAAGITPSGGSEVTCTFVHGELGALKSRVDLWQRPGVDGYGAQRVGDQDSGFSFTCVMYDTAADIDDWIDDVNACQGQVCTIENDRGDYWGDLLVTSISTPAFTATTNASGQRCEMVVSGVQLGI